MLSKSFLPETISNVHRNENGMNHQVLSVSTEQPSSHNLKFSFFVFIYINFNLSKSTSSCIVVGLIKYDDKTLSAPLRSCHRAT